MWRRWLLWLLGALFVWLVISRLSELERLGQILRQGQWPWIVGAIALYIGYYLLYAALYQAAFFTVGIQTRIKEILPVFFAALFVDVAAPSGGASSAALYIDDAAQSGHPPARAAAAVLLARMADYGTFFLVLVIGLLYLSLYHRLQGYEVIGALILFAIVVSMGGVLALARVDPGLLTRLLARVEQVVNGLAAHLRLKPPLPPDWGHRNAAEFTEAALAIAAHPGRLTRVQTIAMCIYIVHVLSLWSLFLAFQQPIRFGPMLAGYAIGMLFWVVSITPHGVGIVEGVMVLLYNSLGVPPDKATIIVLAFRGLTFWLPLVAGFWMLRRLKSFRPRPPTVQRPPVVVRAAAVVTALMGLLNLISSVQPVDPSRAAALVDFSPPELQELARIGVALAGFGLFLLSMNLRQARRRAWTATLIVLGLTVLGHLFKSLSYEQAAVAFVLGTWLAFWRPHFYARSPLPRYRNGLIVLVAAISYTLAYGALGFVVLSGQLSPDFGLESGLRETLRLRARLDSPASLPLTPFARAFVDSIYTVAAVTSLYAGLTFIRPAMIRRPATADERTRARSIVTTYGRSYLAHFALLPDKSYVFTPGGSVIAYVLKGKVALALSDPIGPPSDIVAAVAHFRHYCARHGWFPAVYLAQPEYVAAYRAQGWRVLAVTRQALLDLRTVHLDDPAMARPASEHATLAAQGYQLEVHNPPHRDDLWSELQALNAEWLILMRTMERRFSVGWLDRDYLEIAPIMTVRSAQKELTAFATLWMNGIGKEVGIDLLRWGRKAGPEIRNFLVISLILWAQSQGFDRFHLGWAPLPTAEEQTDDPTERSALHYIAEHMSEFYAFRGLALFAQALGPNWTAQYLVFPSVDSLPAILSALIRADSGDDSLWDYVSDFLLRL